jgi:hypothetical protein
MTTDRPEFVLTLRAGADPQARHGHAERDEEYRLKLALKVLLRSFGLRCVSVRPAIVRRRTVGDNGSSPESVTPRCH